MRIKYFFLLLLYPFTIFAAPDWATKNTLANVDNKLSIVCSGQGPSIDLARDHALSSCQASATRYVQENLDIKSLSVETEKNVGFHQEVSTSGSFKNVKCHPEREEIESSEASYIVWLKCKFNLSQIVGTSGKLEKDISSKSRKLSIGKDTIQVTISTIPKCDSIIIRGLRSRTEACSTNPIKLNIYSEDLEFIIRAENHKPLTISAQDLKARTTSHFVLEPL